MSTETHSITANIERIRERLARAAARAGRGAGETTIVAASKTFPAEAIREAFETGVREFGENRVQEWESKQTRLADLDAKWHLIGHLQGNKARRAAHLFDRIDSVDRWSLAQKLDSAAEDEGKRLPVLIEVQLGNEASKSGIEEPGLAALAEGITALPRLELLGLMTIPPYFEDAEKIRPYFRRLRELRDDLSHALDCSLPVLSMGMSHDFEVAIEEGSTEVRIGRAIFGARAATREQAAG
ncbi:MAG TPA: YggS family pyridoxal phosphate-dependent enzyme [Candidatus Acidoferrales bacterium]|nr:YggS family pyridoxal phosphate-dependent enzyme [Candidatus Acidoferrales bacterium]